MGRCLTNFETYNKRRVLPPGEAPCRSLFRRYKRQAKKHNREFGLTLPEFRILTQNDCFYCGKKPAQVERHAHGLGDYIYNGIDRRDNNHGYISGNCFAACGTCNFMKRDLTFKQFLFLIGQIYEHQHEQN